MLYMAVCAPHWPTAASLRCGTTSAMRPRSWGNRFPGVEDLLARLKADRPRDREVLDRLTRCLESANLDWAAWTGFGLAAEAGTRGPAVRRAPRGPWFCMSWPTCAIVTWARHI